ncbi:glycosyltransferase family protein [Phenylobacterium sp.]|uniref:glycosyltransferase family protein n=1 Tax=Phenylobacterium sp. TaxID=1871053 RepID=UPI002EDA1BA3
MILAILQARMSSSRLPGKVLAPVLGEPMIARHVERLRRSQRIDRLVVATSTDPSDTPLAEACERLALPVHRGDLNDVLGRFVGAMADHPGATAVVRLTADCPLADWTVIDALIDRFVAEDADYASTNLPERTWPHGLDAEVIRPEVLQRAHREAADAYEREHVTAFVYRRPDEHRMVGLSRSPPLDHLRWTVDYPEDLAFVRRVYEQLYPQNPAFGSDAIVALPENSSRGGP